MVESAIQVFGHVKTLLTFDRPLYYKETTGYKKYKYPLIEKKSYNSEPEWDGHEEDNEIEGNNSFP